MSITVHPCDRQNLTARVAGKMPTHKQMIVAKTCQDMRRFNPLCVRHAFLIANGVGRCAKRYMEAANE